MNEIGVTFERNRGRNQSVTDTTLGTGFTGPIGPGGFPLPAGFEELERTVAASDAAENIDGALDVLVGLLGDEERERMLDRWRPTARNRTPQPPRVRKPAGPSAETREKLAWRDRTLWRLRMEQWPDLTDSNAARMLMIALTKYRDVSFPHDKAAERRPSAEPRASFYDLLMDGVKLLPDAKALRNNWSKRKSCA